MLKISPNKKSRLVPLLALFILLLLVAMYFYYEFSYVPNQTLRQALEQPQRELGASSSLRRFDDILASSLARSEVFLKLVAHGPQELDTSGAGKENPFESNYKE